MSTPDSLLGAVIDGRYEVRGRIARGGMATVYRAHDRRLEREVALKVMHPHLAESEAFVTRFRREARSAARLSHPNAVAVFDQGLWRDSFYLTMEYVDGMDLRDRLRRERSLTVGAALEITRDVLDALGAAHRRDLIHRDIKPENVLLTSDGVPKVADFGLARAVSDATAASTGTVLGTVAYLAPELVQHGNATAASDVYAVGVMLYEMLTGRQPFQGEVPINIAFQHVTSSVPAPSAELDWLPQEVDDLLAALTARDPSERLADGDAALARVRQVLASLGPETLSRRRALAPEPPGDLQDTAGLDARPSSGTVALPIGEGGVDEPAAPAANPRPRRRRRGLVVALLVLLAAGATTAWYLLWGPGAYAAMPSVVSLPQDQAEQILADAGFTVSVDEAHHDTRPIGEVIGSDPLPHEAVRKGSDVTIVVSLGILRVAVPDVVDTPQDDALAALGEFSTQIEVVESYHQEIESGHVISLRLAADTVAEDGETIAAETEPDVGTPLPHSSQLVLAVSKGKEPVSAPEVLEMEVDAAIAEIEEAGLVGREAGEREYHDSIPEGHVISQSHTGEGLYRGDTVELTVSQGPELVQVPSVVGMSQQNAEQSLRDAGLVPVVTDGWLSILDLVRTQSESAGSWIPKGSAVEIQVV